MSGHSKWSTIKRQKGATDAKRGNLFTKLANVIAIATREGGSGDPNFNFKLRLAIEKAKEANMPKENIQRSVDRGLGKGEGVTLEQAVFEGFGPGGVAVIIEAITNNTTRTAAELRNVFEKNGGHLAGQGAVAYMFTRVGEIEGETLEKAVEVGALDFEDGILYTKPEDLHKISEVLGKAGSLIFRPNKDIMVKVADPEKLEGFISALHELDDVQEVFTNTK